MNLNLVHNLINIVCLVIGSLVTVDWTALGMSSATAATVAGGILAAQSALKIVMNITRDGLGGLVKPQPPVQ